MMSLTEIAAVGLFAIKVLESNFAAQASVYMIVSKHQKLRLETFSTRQVAAAINSKLCIATPCDTDNPNMLFLYALTICTI